MHIGHVTPRREQNEKNAQVDRISGQRHNQGGTLVLVVSERHRN
jgi:hypothetical protein